MADRHPTPDSRNSRQAGVTTSREKERRAEDRTFVPVIVKRTDEARRHPDDILQMAVREGLEQLERPAISLFLSAIAAGLVLSFTVMAVAVVRGAFPPETPESWLRIGAATVYPLGFVLCIMSGAQLFTEHTATAVYPVLDRKAGGLRLVRLWALVLSGNLVGAAVAAGLLTAADGVVGASDAYVEMGRQLVAPDTGALVVSAILAGWLMALGAWLILATPPRISQIASIFIVTFLIGLGGLHHSIAGAVEIGVAVLVGDEIGWASGLEFIGKAGVGNLIGGSLFVAFLNYAHIRQSRGVAGGDELGAEEGSRHVRLR